jgi:uncharacterized protein
VLDGEIQVVTSPCVTAEYIAVASRAKFHAYGFPPIWLGTLIRNSLALADPESFPHPCPDPKDTPFLALAKASGAWLVTGNLKHFPEHLRGGVVVVSPAECLGRLGIGRCAGASPAASTFYNEAVCRPSFARTPRSTWGCI